MIPYARLMPGPGWQPSRALLYYIQRIVTPPLFRNTVTAAIAAYVRLTHPQSPTFVASGCLDDLRNYGCASLPSLLSEAEIDEMRAYFAAVAPERTMQGQADYSLADVVNCPHVMELANHPLLVGLAASYIGCLPTISTIGVRWSYPTATPPSVQQFHRDPDDWRILKFFAYLTDVTETTGPHVYAKGSHRERAPLWARRYTDSETAARYTRQNLVEFVGPRGTMFMADTGGVHKGASPTASPRLMLEVGHTLLPVFALRYSPVRLKEKTRPFDRYVNRLILLEDQR